MRNLKLFWHRLLNSNAIMLDGIKICTTRDKMPRSVRSSLFKGTHEAHERQLVAKHLDRKDRVLEIGAATGVVSLFCARKCGAENVLSYEANPAMEWLIRKNFELNGWTPNLVMKAVTREGKNIDFFVSENIYSSSLINRSETLPGKNITVPSDPIGEIIGQFKPTAIVMDVEGAEIELLGNVELDCVSKIIVELHPHITGQKPVDGLMSIFNDQEFVVRETAHKTVFLQKIKE